MRKVYGKDGRASHLMKSFLPSTIFFFVMDSFFKKVFMKEAA
jgi:hypothetical protein